jgi:excisionase family DNA binding protein
VKTRSGGLLSATQVARFCAVDLKTVHNWANKGKIAGTRTTGRHLRFRPLDVVDFLRAYAFDLPEALRHFRLRVLLVDASSTALAASQRALSRRFDVSVAEHVVDGLLAASTLLPDVLVVGDVTPLDPATLEVRLHALEATRHVRVVPRGDPARLREAVERLLAP